ncbi:hypothetical protein [Corynebacterium sp. H78]|uniref:hypothetical protein n=1 Tax=Corynebacterium sp. H78 TaxID=3133417 RepID=UPI0030AC2261
MRIVVLQCGSNLSLPTDQALASEKVTLYDVPTLPTRKDLVFLSDIAAEMLPEDTVPTPDDIAKSKEVPHMGSPRFAPQKPTEPVRIVVVGPDASLGAVATFLMRRNLLWFEVAHVPDSPSSVTKNWDISGSGEFGLSLDDALTRDVHPVPLIRDDTGHAIVGYALLTEVGISGPSSRLGLVGEVYVDEHRLFSGTSNGVQVRPTPDAPGLVGAEVPWVGEKDATEADAKPGFFARLFGRGKDAEESETAEDRPLHPPIEGRAVQAGGPGFRYVRDGIEAKKPREKVTIYRHLLDLQLVR